MHIHLYCILLWSIQLTIRQNDWWPQAPMNRAHRNRNRIRYSKKKRSICFYLLYLKVWIFICGTYYIKRQRTICVLEFHVLSDNETHLQEMTLLKFTYEMIINKWLETYSSTNLLKFGITHHAIFGIFYNYS